MVSKTRPGMHRYSIYFPNDLYKSLKMVAESDDRSVQGEVIALLRRAINDRVVEITRENR